MRVSLVILAAGRSSRFGRPKALEPVGPSGEALFEYAICDAIRAGCERAVFVCAPESAALLEAQVRGRIGSALPFEIVPQRLDDLPPGFRPPPDRRKPWGTGHAVLAVRELVREPFLVLNADDFYGPGVLERLARRLLDARTTGDPSHFLVGYELRATPMSPAGGVNRGICRTDASLVLRWLEEVRGIRPAGTPGRFVGTGEDGTERTLPEETLSSMNLWAFQPSVFEPLAAAFQRFHARLADPDEDEFLLSSAVGTLVETGRARVRVVPAETRAAGLTFEEDRPAVVSAVALAVAEGAYPFDLPAWFEGRQGQVPG